MQNTSISNTFPYLYRGIVKDNNDPKNLGRCRISVPSIHGNQEITPNYLPWARGISTIAVTGDRGSSCVPEIGDIVWVLFEGGDDEFPVYIGGTHGTSDTPVSLNEIVLYQENGNHISYDKANRRFLLNVGECSLIVGEEGITISGDTDLLGNLGVTGNIQINGNLSIAGNMMTTGSVGISGDLDVSGNIRRNGVPVITIDQFV